PPPCGLLRRLSRARVTPSHDQASPLTALWVRLAAHLPAATVAWLRDALDRDPAAGAGWEQGRPGVWGGAPDSQLDVLAAEARRRRQPIAQRLAADLSP